MNILVVSPHRNDAAFSLALAIKGWLAARHRVTVLGVFSRSVSAPFSDADTVHPNDLLSYVSAMRRREDAELLKLMPGLRMVDLNLKDAPVRLRCSPEDMYTIAPSPEDTAVAKIQKALAKLATEQTIDAVLLPLALGHHVDHLVVRNATLGFAAGRLWGFYEDLPDAFRAGDAGAIEASVELEFRALREANLFVEAARPVVLGADLDVAAASKAKRRIVSVYASQVDGATIEAISDLAEHYAGGERVWGSALFPPSAKG